MSNLKNNIIVINRGDSYTFDLTINDASAENGCYILEDNDTVYFGLMDPNQPFEDALVRKKYTIDDIDLQDPCGTLTIQINPEDTLDLIPGKYYYAVKLKMDHWVLLDDGENVRVEDVVTVINKTKFIICD